jgi:hypothetical protein
MDKRYYYRILGVREGASAADIKKAYDRHMRRLNLPDYGDDPEYVARKKDQIRHAYNVLVGGSAPTTAAQDKAKFEKWKDAEDSGEDALAGLKRAFDKHTRSCEPKTEISASLQEMKTMLEETFGGKVFANRENNGDEDRNSKLLKIIVIGLVCLSLFGSLITACGAMVINAAGDIAEDLTFGATPEHIFEGAAAPAVPDISEEQFSEESAERIELILENNHKYDFYGNLDLSTQEEFQDQIEWSVSEDSEDYIWQNTADLADMLGLWSVSDIVAYMTGDPDLYWELDDYSNSEIVTKLMNPPAYEEIAGGCNLYTREIILNYNGYLRFLTDVAFHQSRVAEGLAE